MKYFIYLFCLTAILSCTKDEVGDIRPLIPGEYNGEMSYWEYNDTTEEFDLNLESFPVSAVVTKVDHSNFDLYKIEFSKNHPIDIPAFNFTLYPLFETYGYSAFIRVSYSGGDPCPFYFSYFVDEMNAGHFSKGRDLDKMYAIITYYSCSEPEDSFKIQFIGNQNIN